MIYTENIKTWKKLEDGTMELVSTEQITVDEPTNEEVIANKEAELLSMYTELQALKEANK